jgi:hypothetical protein
LASTSGALTVLGLEKSHRPISIAEFSAATRHGESAARPSGEGDTAPTTVPGQEVRHRFPESIAGFGVGTSLAETSRRCSDRNGQKRIRHLASRDWAECPFLPVDLSFAVPPVALRFAAGGLTEVTLHARSLAVAGSALVDKYGPPDSFDTGAPRPEQWDWTGSPGNATWRLAGGEVVLSTQDTGKVVVHYRSDLALEAERQDY